MQIIFEEHISRRKHPINIVHSDVPLFEHEFEKKIQETHLLEISNGIVLNDYIVAGISLKKYLAYSQIHPVSYKFIIKRFLLLRNGFKTIKEGIWITDNWSSGYFHWLTDALPRLLASRRINETYPVLLPEQYEQIGYVRESLNLIGASVLFYKNSVPSIVKKLLLVSHTADTGNYNGLLINELREKLLASYSARGERKIFISRLKASKRKIINETEVVDYLRSNSWEIHYFEDYSLGKQIGIMAETKYLIGLHGAGLTNMLFMRQGGKVLELRNENDSHNNCYFSLASELAIDYHYQLNQGDKADTFFVNVTVNMDVLKKNIEKMTW